MAYVPNKNIAAKVRGIDEIRVYKNEGSATFVGTANISVNGIVIQDVQVVNGKNGLFVKFPQRSYKDSKTNETKWKDIVYFLDNELKEAVKTAILDCFKAL